MPLFVLSPRNTPFLSPLLLAGSYLVPWNIAQVPPRSGGLGEGRLSCSRGRVSSSGCEPPLEQDRTFVDSGCSVPGTAANVQTRRVRREPGREGLDPPRAMNTRERQRVLLRPTGPTATNYRAWAAGVPLAVSTSVLQSGLWEAAALGFRPCCSEVLVAEPKAWVFLERNRREEDAQSTSWGWGYVWRERGS